MGVVQARRDSESAWELAVGCISRMFLFAAVVSPLHSQLPAIPTRQNFGVISDETYTLIVCGQAPAQLFMPNHVPASAMPSSMLPQCTKSPFPIIRQHL